MRTCKAILSAIVAAGGMTATLSAAAYAQDWPQRPISMIVAYSAGGGTDVMARTIVPYLEKYIGDGARFAVVNRPGAGGEIGFTAIAQARPDGHTIGMINVPALITPLIDRSPEYTLESFAPIANLVLDPAALVVRADAPWKTLEEFIDHIRENPNVVTVSNGAFGGAMHMAAMRFAEEGDLEIIHVPFPGTAPSRTAVMGGHITSAFMGLGEAASLHEEGQLRILATMAAERGDLAPDVPTFREKGIDVVWGSFRGLAAPAGVPDVVMERLVNATRKTFDDPDFREQAKQQNLPLSFLSPDEYLDVIAGLRNEIQRLSETLRN